VVGNTEGIVVDGMEDGVLEIIEIMDGATVGYVVVTLNSSTLL